MKATIKDIAREAGVSETTVSLAFQPGSRVSDPTRRKLLAVARRLNYMPNMAARHLRSGSTRTIGFLVNDITNPFYTRMVRIAERIAQSHGYQIVLAESEWKPEKEVAVVESMIQSRIKGMLVCFCEKTGDSLDLLTRFRVPFIVVDTYPATYRGSFIANDLVEAGRLAAEHLLSIGCRRPAFLTAEHEMASFSAFRRLKQGFTQALKQHGTSIAKEHVLCTGLTIGAGKAGFHRLRDVSPKVDGIFCANDLCALGVVEAADQRGLCIGRDLAVMGIDDLEISAMERISLTSIRQPNERIVDLAANALIEQIERKTAPKIQKVIKPELIVRQSTQSTTATQPAA